MIVKHANYSILVERLVEVFKMINVEIFINIFNYSI
jgi:hypothetical protein